MVERGERALWAPFCETGSHYVAWAGLKLTILLPQPPEWLKLQHLAWTSFLRTLIPFTRVAAWWPDHLPKTPSLTIITLVIFSMYKFLAGTQNFRAWYALSVKFHSTIFTANYSTSYTLSLFHDNSRPIIPPKTSLQFSHLARISYFSHILDAPLSLSAPWAESRPAIP
jgi:hypothetical protein